MAEIGTGWEAARSSTRDRFDGGQTRKWTDGAGEFPFLNMWPGFHEGSTLS